MIDSSVPLAFEQVANDLLNVSERNFDSFVNLCRSMRTQRSMALIGAGVSKAAGFPTWDETICALHEAVMQKLGEIVLSDFSKNYLNAIQTMDDVTWQAEEYRFLLGEQFNATINGIFSITPSEAGHRLARDILNLPFSQILTTNYDLLLESNMGPAVNVVDWSERQQVQLFLNAIGNSSAARHLVYLHGQLSNPASIVLCEKDYTDRYILNDETHRKLFVLFTTFSVIFIGFSLTDPDLISLLRVANTHLGSARPRHFALLRIGPSVNGDSAARILAGKYGVEVVFYKDHFELNTILNAINFSLENSDWPQNPSGIRYTSDPHKGRFSGYSSKGALRLSASVVKNKEDKFFSVQIAILDSKQRSGSVKYFLHPSFSISEVNSELVDGVSVCSVDAVGAFTVGALINIEGAEIDLELDLSKVHEAPLLFRLS